MSCYMDAVCEQCGETFQCQKFRIEEHNKGIRKHLFCSTKCKAEFRKNQTVKNCVCPVCGKEFHSRPSYILETKNICCSKECATVLRRTTMAGENNHQYGLKGDKNASWKSDDKISFYGYKLIRDLAHPFVNCDGFVFEHRIVAEKYLLTEENSIEIDGKKYLSPDYVVHHIDGDRLNNSPDNLQIMTKGEHTALHSKERKTK